MSLVDIARKKAPPERDIRTGRGTLTVVSECEKCGHLVAARIPFPLNVTASGPKNLVRHLCKPGGADFGC